MWWKVAYVDSNGTRHVVAYAPNYDWAAFIATNLYRMTGRLFVYYT